MHEIRGRTTAHTLPSLQLAYDTIFRLTIHQLAQVAEQFPGLAVMIFR